MPNNQFATQNTPSSTVYFTVRDVNANVANGSSFVTFVDGNFGQYAMSMTESPSGSGYYVGTFPSYATGSTTALATYFITAYLQAGGSPAISDTVIAQLTILWDGTNLQQAATLANQETIIGDLQGLVGSGPVGINQDTSGTDNLRFVDSNGNGVANVSVVIQDVSNSNNTITANGVTNASGRWNFSLYVPHGTYTCTGFIANLYNPTTSAPFTI